ncbi:hypothetical protein BJ508DRAFT_314344 [Ascobolus immersus RN42]|uniref:PXA domain-containing protein n=1 Tax=Ascobolus immersus RN42 TaxID=1160509 RepID=A0A3N4HH97_ASCIM|nr:hypothetical protein BJ508DRAFT_314344 [Ascobolus immersus RN42]
MQAPDKRLSSPPQARSRTSPSATLEWPSTKPPLHSRNKMSSLPISEPISASTDPIEDPPHLSDPEASSPPSPPSPSVSARLQRSRTPPKLDLSTSNLLDIPTAPPTVKITEPPPVELESPLGVQDRILVFIANADTPTLVLVFVGVTGVLYVIIGRLSLFIAGLTVGVLVRGRLDGASVGNKIPPGRDVEKEKGEMEVDVKKAPEEEDRTVTGWEELPVETGKALKELVGVVVREYVEFWYHPLLPAETIFPNSVQTLLNNTILNIASRLQQEKPAALFIALADTTTSHLTALFSELQTALGATNSSPDNAIEAVKEYTRLYPRSDLAQLVDPVLQRQRLRVFAAQFIEAFIEREARECAVVRKFMIEVLSGVVLDKVLDSMLSPEAIVDWAIYLLDDAPPEIVSKDMPMSPITPLRSGHRREVSQAEKAMELAMKEAEELSRMIREEETANSPVLDEPVLHSVEDEDTVPSLPELQATPVSSAPRQRPFSMPAEPKGARLNAFINNYDTEMVHDGDSPPAPQPSHRLSAPPPSQFTSFDQIAPPPRPEKPSLHLATTNLINLSDTPTANLRSRPASAAYVITVEPSAPHATGWLLTRRFAEFETLATTLSTSTPLPSWREAGTTDALGQRLEEWVNGLLRDKALAEDASLVRFLEKDDDPSAHMQQEEEQAQAGVGNPFAGLAKVGSVVGGGLSELVGGGQSRGGLFAGRGRGGLFGGGRGRGGLFGGRGGGETRSSGIFGASSAATGTGVVRGGGLFGGVASWGKRNSVSSATPPNFSREGSASDLAGVGTREDWFGKDTSYHRPTSDEIAREEEAEKESEKEKEKETEKEEIKAGFDLTPSEIHASESPQSRSSTDSDRSDDLAAPTTTATPQITTTALLPLLPKFLAMITSLYNLSPFTSSIRLSLLSLALSVISRPNNTALLSITTLINTALEDYTSDAYLAYTVQKVILALTAQQEETREEGGKRLEEKKRRARELVLERAVPMQVRSVMGERASREAVGVVWDALVEGVGGGVGKGVGVQVLGDVGGGFE